MIGARNVFCSLRLSLFACGMLAVNVLPAQAGVGVSADQYPDADAVILKWDQSWKLADDGRHIRREHKMIQLFSRRPIRSQADPRIDFVQGRDQVTVHVARTHLADGGFIDAPEYAFNIAAPSDVAGWPTYANWQQQIVSFSGIEPGVVLELDYEVVTPSGALPWLEGSINLQHEYPIAERVVTVSSRSPLQIQGNGNVFATAQHETSNEGLTHRWVYRDVPGSPQESQAPPLYRRGGTFSFSTCPGAVDWTRRIVQQVADSAAGARLPAQFAKKAVEQEADPKRQIRLVVEKMKQSFNFVHSPKSFEGLQCRKADNVLRGQYGNPLESAAVLLAALSSLGMQAQAVAAVDAHRWSSESGIAPTSAMLSAVLVAAELKDGMAYVHPERGMIHSPGSWSDQTLLSIDDRGALSSAHLPAWESLDDCELSMNGKLSVDGEWTAAGEVRLRLGGLFFDVDSLEEADAQKKLIAALIDRVLTGFDVSSHSVASLSSREFRAVATIASKEGLPEIGGLRVLELGKGPAFLKDIPLPLSQSTRRHSVLLKGPVQERVEWAIDFSKAGELAFEPAFMPAATHAWGRAAQDVKTQDKSLRFTRHIEIKSKQVSANEFASLRQVAVDLGATQFLTVGFKD